jgi:Rieske Fe-S protein
LRRAAASGPPQAFTAVCPHLGCFVDYKPAAQRFQCPCHNSAWTPDGERIDPKNCPSPRGLDPLQVELRGNEVWVIYQRFRGGIADRVAES